MKKTFVIKKYREYQEIIKEKRFKKTNGYTVYYQNTQNNITRVGILVGKRNGIAVTRNKIKRQVRMMLDELINYDLPLNIIIAISRNYDSNKFKENFDELGKIINSIKGEINE